MINLYHLKKCFFKIEFHKSIINTSEMSETYNLQISNYENITKEVFKYLNDIERNSKKSTKYHFNGGNNDSNQTKYEKLGTMLKICVVSKEETTAKCLHLFLRLIYDDHNFDAFLGTNRQLLTPSLSSFYEKDLTIEQIVDLIVKDTGTYFHTHDLRVDGLEVVSMKDGEFVKKYIADVYCWNIFQISDRMFVNLEEFPDVD